MSHPHEQRVGVESQQSGEIKVVTRRFSNLQALAPASARRGRDGNDPSPEPIRYQRTRAFARGRAPV